MRCCTSRARCCDPPLLRVRSTSWWGAARATDCRGRTEALARAPVVAAARGGGVCCLPSALSSLDPSECVLAMKHSREGWWLPLLEPASEVVLVTPTSSLLAGGTVVDRARRRPWVAAA